MTRDEFGQWIELHYGELLSVARRLVRRDPHDVVHQAVAGALEAEKYPETAPWTWMVNRIRGYAANARRGEKRREGAVDSMKGEEEKGSGWQWKKKLPPEQRGVAAADDYYLKRLEEDRRDFDMDGYGRSKKDKPFDVRLGGE